MPAHSPTGDAPLGDCYTTWKPNWSTCDQSRLAMHRHHRYASAIATGYGEVRLQIPVFPCGQCRRMAGGMTLLGADMRHQRFSKKTVTSPSAWPRKD